MDPSPAAPARSPWISLWVVALISLLAQLWLCQFFTGRVPLSIDVNPANMWKYAYHFPPSGEFLTLNWLGIANLPPTLNPFSLAAANLSPWLFFTAYAPVIATLSLLAMATFLRELELPRPAALFGGVIYAWQGDLLPFVFPGHYAYITTWPFFALAAWAVLRGQRTRHWAYALIAGACCGMMVGLQPDRGSIASLLIAALYLGPALHREENLRRLFLCAGTALAVSLAAFLALFQSYIVGVKLGASADREQTFHMATQFSLGPQETLTYLVPGFFGWHSSHIEGPYWGWIGRSFGWEQTQHGVRNLNLAISTTGTVATLLALVGVLAQLPGVMGFFFGRGTLTARQLAVGRLLLILGAVSLLLSWGYHTPLYRPLFALPLMDKWRNPLKWLEIANFALITLSAFGVQQALRSLDGDAARLRRALQIFFGTATGLLAIGLASYPLVAIVLVARLGHDGYEGTAIANVMHTLPVSLGFALVLAGAAWVFLIDGWQVERLRRRELVNPWLDQLWKRMFAPEHLPLTLAMGFALLGALQLGWVATQFIEPTPLERLTATNPLVQALKEEGPAVRVAVPGPQDPLLNFLLQNQFASERISSVDISAASRIPDALDNFLHAFDRHPARLWFLAGVKNVAVAQETMLSLRQDAEVAANIEKADGYTLVETGMDQPTHALVRLRDYLAKATFVPKADVIADPAEQLKKLADPKWDPRQSILVSAPPNPSAGTASKSNRAAQVTVTTYTPHEIGITVDAPAAGYLLINDQYDPDWQVELNGKPAPLLRADYLFRAVAVPAGASTVGLRYVAHYHVAGLDLPVIATNLFSDGAFLMAWLIAAFSLSLSRSRSKTTGNVAII